MPFPFVASGTVSDADLLAICRETIAAVLVGGQEVEIRGRKFTAPDLGELRALEKQLTGRASSAASGLAFNHLRRGKAR